MSEPVTAVSLASELPITSGGDLNRARFESGQTFADFLASASALADLWHAVYAHAHAPDSAVARLAAVGGAWHLLVLTEDWCGDAVNTLPVLARLVERVPNVDLRILGRDANPDIMDAHLTNGSRSIPVVMVLDAQYRERAWWGPRPRVLQEWFVATGRFLPKPDRYRELRRWYAPDHGATTVAEIVALVETSAAADAGLPAGPRREVDAR